MNFAKKSLLHSSLLLGGFIGGVYFSPIKYHFLSIETLYDDNKRNILNERDLIYSSQNINGSYFTDEKTKKLFEDLIKISTDTCLDNSIHYNFCTYLMLIRQGKISDKQKEEFYNKFQKIIELNKRSDKINTIIIKQFSDFL